MNNHACKEFCKHISHTFKVDLVDELSIMVDQWSNRCLMFRRRNCIFTVRNDNYTFAKRKPEKKSKSCIKNCNDSFNHIIIYSNSLCSSLYDFHIFMTSSSSFHGFITNQFNNLFPVGLLAQLVRALHGYRRGQGFESRTSLNFFQAFFS